MASMTLSGRGLFKTDGHLLCLLECVEVSSGVDMAIQFHPDRGDVLICDFSDFKAPEMTKRRPVVVLSPKRRHGPDVVTVVPLSTMPPNPQQIWHCKLSLALPDPYSALTHWVKGDMVYSVALRRLNLFKLGKDDSGKRQYEYVSLTPEQLADVEQCVLNGLGFYEEAKRIRLAEAKSC
jgi:uncharacterized protein YifN (PemK superfamily)